MSIRKIETRLERYNREQVMLAIEEVTGVQREYWENSSGKGRASVRINRLYILMLHMFLGLTPAEIRDTLPRGYTYSRVTQSLRVAKKWLTTEPRSREILAIKKNYEARPPYNFDTIA